MNEAAAVYHSGGRGLGAMVDDLVTRLDPLDAVGVFSKAIEERLQKSRKPKAKFAASVMRGVAAREELKQAEGGSYSAEETRVLLGISKTAVLKRYQKGQMLGWREAGQGAVRFPVWQIDEGDLLRGVREVLTTFQEAPWVDDWGKISFFLTPRASLGNKRPLDLLRERDHAAEMDSVHLICDAARASFE